MRVVLDHQKNLTNLIGREPCVCVESQVQRGQIPQSDLKNLEKEFTPAELERWSMVSNTPVGRLHHLSPVLQLSETPARWDKTTVPLGHHQPVWPS